MKIRYALFKTDLFKARMINLVMQRSMWFFFLLMFGLTLWTTLTSPRLVEKGVAFLVVYMALQMLFISLVWFSFAAVFTLLQMMGSSAKGVVGEHTLEITDEGLVESTAYNRSLHRWSGFCKVKRAGGFAWIYATESQLHVIPMNKPLLEGELALFLERVQECVARAAGTPPALPR